MANQSKLKGATPAEMAKADCLCGGTGWQPQRWLFSIPRALEMVVTRTVYFHKEKEKGVQTVCAIPMATAPLKWDSGNETSDVELGPLMLGRSIHNTPIQSIFRLQGAPKQEHYSLKPPFLVCITPSSKINSTNWASTGGHHTESGSGSISSLSSQRARHTRQRRGRHNQNRYGGQRGEGGGEGDANGGRLPTRRPPEPDEELRYFACPYYKYDTRRHWRCYRRYSFNRVTDVKSHLERVHLIRDYYCAICYQEFEDIQRWQSHALGNACQPSGGTERLFMQEFDELRRILNRARGMSDTDKWYLMFEYIFPNVPRPASPYVSSSFGEPLAIVREQAYLQSSRVVATLYQHGVPVPLEGAGLTSLLVDLVHSVVPESVDAMVTNPPYERAVAPTHSWAWYHQLEPQDVLQQNPPTEEPQAPSGDDQQIDTQPPEERWPQ